jgi:hypothetical protein
MALLQDRRWPKPGQGELPKVDPPILGASFARIGEEISALKEADAERIRRQVLTLGSLHDQVRTELAVEARTRPRAKRRKPSVIVADAVLLHRNAPDASEDRWPQVSADRLSFVDLVNELDPLLLELADVMAEVRSAEARTFLTAESQWLRSRHVRETLMEGPFASEQMAHGFSRLAAHGEAITIGRYFPFPNIAGPATRDPDTWVSGSDVTVSASQGWLDRVTWLRHFPRSAHHDAIDRPRADCVFGPVPRSETKELLRHRLALSTPREISDRLSFHYGLSRYRLSGRGLNDESFTRAWDRHWVEERVSREYAFEARYGTRVTDRPNIWDTTTWQREDSREVQL